MSSEMTNWHYRILEAGEIIDTGDEFEYISGKWYPVTHSIGMRVPPHDPPNYQKRRTYRRKIEDGGVS